jgi:nitroreductase
MERSELLHALNWRYATKKFDNTKKISDADWKILEESLRLSPSSFGLQPWKFLIVQNPTIRKQLTPFSWKQTQIEDCSHLVVITTMKKMTEKHIAKFINQTAKTRGMEISALAGYSDMMNQHLIKGPAAETSNFWTQKQSYIAMGFLMEAAALLNIDTCPIEGIEPAQYDKILGLENTDYKTVAVVACGYRSSEDNYAQLKKVRFDSEDVIQFI